VHVLAGLTLAGWGEWGGAVRALALLVTANACPWALGRLLGQSGALALDFGRRLPDGQRLFGEHKTWRGLLSGTGGCALVAMGLALPAWVGAAFGALALTGDALSSALKRRLHLRPGADSPGLDQLPEALLPLAALSGRLGLEWGSAAAVLVVFVVLDMASARLRHPRP